MRAQVRPEALLAYMRQLLSSGEYDRLLAGRCFQGTVFGVVASTAGFLVTVQRAGEDGSDGNEYLCVVPGYYPAVGDVVEIMWLDRNVGWVLGPTGGSATVAAGLLSIATVAAAQTGITAITALTGLTVSPTTLAGRRYRVSGYIPTISSTVANDQAQLSIQEDGVTVQLANVNIGSSTANGEHANISVYVTPSVGAHTYALYLARLGGTGTVSINAGSTFPAYISVEDVGAA